MSCVYSDQGLPQFIDFCFVILATTLLHPWHYIAIKRHFRARSRAFLQMTLSTLSSVVFLHPTHDISTTVIGLLHKCCVIVISESDLYSLRLAIDNIFVVGTFALNCVSILNPPSVSYASIVSQLSD